MVDSKPKANVPNWVKILIGAVCLFLGLGVGLGITVIIQLKNGMEKSQDPAYRRSVARSIAEFSDPLPDGFSYGSAMDNFGIKSVVINHTPEQMDVTLSEIDIRDPEKLKQIEEKSGGDTATTDESSTGTIKIANHILKYHIGQQSLDKNSMTMLDGKISDIPEKFITVSAFSDGAKPFDLKLFQKLTDSIKSFGPEASGTGDTSSSGSPAHEAK